MMTENRYARVSLALEKLLAAHGVRIDVLGDGRFEVSRDDRSMGLYPSWDAAAIDAAEQVGDEMRRAWKKFIVTTFDDSGPQRAATLAAEAMARSGGEGSSAE